MQTSLMLVMLMMLRHSSTNSVLYKHVELGFVCSFPLACLTRSLIRYSLSYLHACGFPSISCCSCPRRFTCSDSPQPSTVPNTAPAGSPYPAHLSDLCTSRCSRSIHKLSRARHHYLVSAILVLSRSYSSLLDVLKDTTIGAGFCEVVCEHDQYVKREASAESTYWMGQACAV